ncbi:class I SAM-dependent RNA methyltransferase [Amphiplicatus metriothermophilus]|uniref:23S rRNA m(5)U-1939 methyltransferase n=1 Tax=Amphiplicatus metriothermophilus TaxID=1519374 RepID=A0A239PIU0_9PROT|nr:class I SAM-dependent RNA methyltransferase [Amphiplicatus metriothermophilus]MBB5518119.1 23S rRNA (uracil1939-C5)-methyltransferase [Amphiplicatus metriothermophilus]SNT67547.1 23S rRNA m(5)U-1939 methyltransferase [Amphiplicatus metriothermophilus]
MARARRIRRVAPARVAELVIDHLGARGDGVATVEGRGVFVPYTLPGERVRARIAGERGALEEILTPSPHRFAAPCRHFGGCGGCALQHAARGFYLDWKRRRIIEALARAGLKDAPAGEAVAIPARTRRRAVFAVRRRGGKVLLGFNARASDRIVGIETCEVLHPALFAALPGLKRLCASLPGEWRAFDLAVTLMENGLDTDLRPARGASEPEGIGLLALREAMEAAGVVRIAMNGEALLTRAPPLVRFAGVPVSPPPGGFLQASAEGEAALVRLVLAGATGARRALDLFCGVGAFAFPLSQIATVHAVDADRAAVAALKAAAAHAPCRPVTSEARDLFERPLMGEELEGYDLAVFDPPRAGAKAQAEALAAARVPRVIAVSCNPSTFARDAAILVAGGYRLKAVTPVDQFVYAAHVELVGVFERV